MRLEESLIVNIHLKTLMCLITQGKKISVMENLIKLYLQAFLYLSERLISSSLPCHPISVHWMKVQRSHRCQTIPQRSPKWKATSEWCMMQWKGRTMPFSACLDCRPHLGDWSVEQVNVLLSGRTSPWSAHKPESFVSCNYALSITCQGTDIHIHQGSLSSDQVQ